LNNGAPVKANVHFFELENLNQQDTTGNASKTIDINCVANEFLELKITSKTIETKVCKTKEQEKPKEEQDKTGSNPKPASVGNQQQPKTLNELIYDINALDSIDDIVSFNIDDRNKSFFKLNKGTNSIIFSEQSMTIVGANGVEAEYEYKKESKLNKNDFGDIQIAEDIFNFLKSSKQIGLDFTSIINAFQVNFKQQALKNAINSITEDNLKFTGNELSCDEFKVNLSCSGFSLPGDVGEPTDYKEYKNRLNKYPVDIQKIVAVFCEASQKFKKGEDHEIDAVCFNALKATLEDELQKKTEALKKQKKESELLIQEKTRIEKDLIDLIKECDNEVDMEWSGNALLLHVGQFQHQVDFGSKFKITETNTKSNSTIPVSHVNNLNDFKVKNQSVLSLFEFLFKQNKTHYNFIKNIIEQEINSINQRNKQFCFFCIKIMNISFS
jgi:hypothetical protein